MSAVIVSDPLRPATLAESRHDGGVVLRQGRRFVVLSETELRRVVEFASGRGQLQVYPCSE